ncbi:MAG: type III secretion system chaperone [Pseudomonadota bacterium]
MTASIGFAGAQTPIDPEPPFAAPGEDAELGDPSVAAAAQLRAAVARIDPAAEFTANGAQFRVNQVPITLVYDLNADRMRLVAPVSALDDVEPEILVRLMQANFESALDARYAIAQGVIWSTFIHPLSTLDSEEFGSGIGQTVNLVTTFGGSYTSGAIIFGGGDNVTEERALIDSLQEKTRDL